VAESGFQGPRSPRMFLFACVFAMALGAAAALLRPAPPPTHPGNVSVRVPKGAAVDPRVVQEQLLERLVAEGRLAERPERTAGFGTFLVLVDSDADGHAWVVERLLEPDATAPLRAAFARRLSRQAGPADAARKLLQSLLGSEDPAAVAVALEALAHRGETAEASWPGCRCSYGVHPRRPDGEAWLFARGRAGAALAWAPTEDAGAWTLGVAAAADGAPALVQSTTLASGWSVRGAEDSPVVAADERGPVEPSSD
jgi:hypothetical protein